MFRVSQHLSSRSSRPGQPGVSTYRDLREIYWIRGDAGLPGQDDLENQRCLPTVWHTGTAFHRTECALPPAQRNQCCHTPPRLPLCDLRACPWTCGVLAQCAAPAPVAGEAVAARSECTAPCLLWGTPMCSATECAAAPQTWRR